MSIGWLIQGQWQSWDLNQAPESLFACVTTRLCSLCWDAWKEEFPLWPSHNTVQDLPSETSDESLEHSRLNSIFSIPTCWLFIVRCQWFFWDNAFSTRLHCVGKNYHNLFLIRHCQKTERLPIFHEEPPQFFYTDLFVGQEQRSAAYSVQPPEVSLGKYPKRSSVE